MEEKILENQNVTENQNVSEQQIATESTVETGSSKSNVVKGQRKLFSKVGLGFAIMSVVMALFQIIAMNIVAIFLPEIYEKYFNIVGLLPISIVGFPAFFIMNKIYKSTPAIEQKYKFGFKQFIPFIFIPFGVMMIGNLIGSGINILIANIAGKEMVVVTAELMSGVDLWQNALMVGILAPILEEFLFRKLLIDKFSRFGEGVAILVSALMFGLYHGNIVQFVYATMLGLVLGYVYSKSRKIGYTIIMHMLVNMSSGVLGTWVLGSVNITEIQETLLAIQQTGDMNALSEYTMQHIGEIGLYYGYLSIYGGIVMAGIVLTIVTLVKHIKRGDMLLPGSESLVKGKRFATVVLNVGAILFIVIWVGMIVYSTYTSYFYNPPVV